MKSIKTRIQDLENSLSPKEPTLLELMDMAMARRSPHYKGPYENPKPQSKEELEAEAKEPGLVGLMAQGMLRVMKYREEEKNET